MTASCRICAGGSSRTSTATPVAYDDVAVDDDWCTAASSASCSPPLRAVRWGEVVSVRRARGAGRATARRARGRQLLRREPLLAGRPVPSGRRRRRRSAATARSGVGSLKRRLLALEGTCSERRPLVADARAELAAIAPTRALRPARRDLGALPHRRHASTSSAAARSSFHLDVAASRSPAARSPCSARCGSNPRSGRTGAARFGGATRYQLLVDGARARDRRAGEAGVVDRARLPLDRPPGHVVARPCCRSRVPSRRLPRRRLAHRPALAAPRDPHAAPRGRSVLASVASAAGVRLRVLDRESHSAAYAKSWEAIEAYLSVAGASRRPCSRSRSGRSSPGCGPTQTGSPTPITRTSSGRAARRSAQLEAVARARATRASSSGSPRRSRRPPSCACGTRRSRCASWPPGGPAGDEGRDAPAARPSRRARGRRSRDGLPTRVELRAPQVP